MDAILEKIKMAGCDQLHRLLRHRSRSRSWSSSMLLSLLLLVFSASVSTRCAAQATAGQGVGTDKDKLYSIDKETLLENAADVWYESLSEQELSDHWSYDDGGTLFEKIERLQSFQTTVTVSVKLVGFDGGQHSNMKFSVHGSEISKYLDAAHLNLRGHVINTKHNQSHDLPITTKFVFVVSRASPRLAEHVHNAIQAAVDLSPADLPLTSPAEVAISAVDELIRDDHTQNSLTYTIYILNTPFPKRKPPPNSEFGSNLVNVRYMYKQPSRATTPGFPLCDVSGWVGDDRYVWLDLTAGPVSYGPQTVGNGIFTEFSLPRLERLLPIPGHAHAKFRKHEFISELVASVKKTAQLLVAPSLDRFPIPYVRDVVIHIIVVQESERPLSAADDSSDGTAESVSDSPEELERWRTMIGQLERLALPGQRVAVQLHRVDFAKCELCASAYTHSMKSHTSNVFTDSLRTQVHQFLDSSEMKDWLEHFDRHFWTLRESTITSRREELMQSGEDYDSQVRVITAFLYDLNNEDVLLLDRFHQAVAFDDIVIGVQTKAVAGVVDFSCNSQAMHFTPDDATRPLFASILQAGWGIAPTHDYWHPLLAQTESDYMWSIGDTPFGHFSSSIRLSFVQKDAAARNVLYSNINETISELGSVLHHFSRYKKEIDEVLTSQDHLNFVRRWNVLQYKLQKASQFMNVNNFNQSLYYIQSTRHDLHTLHMLVRAAMVNLQPVMICSQDGWPLASADLPRF